MKRHPTQRSPNGCHCSTKRNHSRFHAALQHLAENRRRCLGIVRNPCLLQGLSHFLVFHFVNALAQGLATPLNALLRQHANGVLADVLTSGRRLRRVPNRLDLGRLFQNASRECLHGLSTAGRTRRRCRNCRVSGDLLRALGLWGWRRRRISHFRDGDLTRHPFVKWKRTFTSREQQLKLWSGKQSARTSVPRAFVVW